MNAQRLIPAVVAVVCVGGCVAERDQRPPVADNPSAPINPSATTTPQTTNTSTQLPGPSTTATNSATAYSSTVSPAPTSTPTFFPTTTTPSSGSTSFGAPKPPAPAGDGLPPIIGVSTLAFGNVRKGHDLVMKNVVKNENTSSTYDLSIRIKGVSISQNQSGAFRVSSICARTLLAEGGSCAIDIVFSPQTVGTFDAMLLTTWEYEYYSGGGTFQTRLIGRGVS